MSYYRENIIEHFNVNESEIEPLTGYPERNTDWFKWHILPDFLSHPVVFARKVKGCKLLDIGCAQGYFTKLYGQHFKEVVGIDFSPPRIDQAIVFNSAPNIRYEVINLAEPVYGYDETFPLAVSSAVYQHIDPDRDRRRAFLNTWLALELNGYLFLYDEDLVTRDEKWNGFYEPLSEAWVEDNISDIFKLESKDLVCRGSHGEYIYRWVLKKLGEREIIL